MTRIAIATVMILCLGLTAHAFDAIGSAFGCMTTARTQGMGAGSFGAGVGIADATSVMGSFNYGLSRYTDGRLKLGFIDSDASNDMELVFGADFKWQIWDLTGMTKHPFDMAIGAFFEYVDFGGASVLELGGQCIGSHSFDMKNGRALTPYGRFNLRMERYSIDFKGESDSKSELKFGINAGVAYQVTNSIDVYGELQLDGNDGLFVGAVFGVM
ncbi:MAG: queuine tRNA-ribosyltransferase family protein [candidate division Zixibacteria bacterium]|nr:queuine tRNA-ribosyltransferase family protein [candidate division Zixibacteria bacterium]